MSKHTGSLARLLDTPHLARLVPQLAPETLHQLIRHAGLEACGELVASATPEQLTSVLDLDLWRHARPGRDEQFDADRFGEWVEALVDTSDTVAARIVAALQPDLVIAGLSRYVRVLDPGVFLPHEASDDEPGDGPIASSDGVECEVGGYLVRAKRPDTWDAIVALLHALEAGHPPRFHEVMQGCRRLSNSAPEVDGLDNLLMEPEQMFHDVAAEREQRRSQVGYSTAADARAFLEMARRRKRQPPIGAPELPNPIAAAYFRAADENTRSSGHDGANPPPRTLGPSSENGSIGAELDAFISLLAEAGVVPERPRALLEGATSQPSRLTRLRPLMEHVRDTNDEAYFARTREMAFLVNTLIAGCSVQSRPFTPQEASDAAAAICNLGLEDLGATLPDAFLIDHDLITAFETGWAALHEDVCLFVAEHLIVTLTDLRSADADIQGGLNALRRELAAQRDAGTPWRARDALDVLAILDMPAWASLLGLLDECPVLPAALTATLERHKGSVSATAFEFISTADQIEKVRAFMGKLLHILGP
jgi:hypothetical protein